MNELQEELKRLGLPENELARVSAYYGDDYEGLAMYVLFMKAMFDDAHQYV